jgi:hypothetical protein
MTFSSFSCFDPTIAWSTSRQPVLADSWFGTLSKSHSSHRIRSDREKREREIKMRKREKNEKERKTKEDERADGCRETSPYV